MNKKNKTKLYAIILGALFVIYILSKYVFNASPESNFDMDILKIDTTNVAKIYIKQKNDKDEIILYKNDGKWFVSQADKQSEADKSSIKSVLSLLANLKIENIAATDNSKWEDFKLTDSLATHIKVANNNGKVIKDLYIGKFTYNKSNNSYGGVSGFTYLRLANNTKSFSVRGFLPMTFNRDFNSFRNQTLLHLTKNNLSKVKFNYPADSSFTVTKADSAIWLINKDTVSKNMEFYLSNIINIRQSKFDDNFKAIDAPIYSLEFFETPKNITLNFYKKDSINYVINSSQNPQAFFVSNKNLINKLLKSKSYFIDK